MPLLIHRRYENPDQKYIQSLQDLFKKHDADKSGSIEFNEFPNLWTLTECDKRRAEKTKIENTKNLAQKPQKMHWEHVEYKEVRNNVYTLLLIIYKVFCIYAGRNEREYAHSRPEEEENSTPDPYERKNMRHFREVYELESLLHAGGGSIDHLRERYKSTVQELLNPKVTGREEDLEKLTVEQLVEKYKELRDGGDNDEGEGRCAWFYGFENQDDISTKQQTTDNNLDHAHKAGFSEKRMLVKLVAFEEYRKDGKAFTVVNPNPTHAKAFYFVCLTALEQEIKLLEEHGHLTAGSTAGQLLGQISALSASISSGQDALDIYHTVDGQMRPMPRLIDTIGEIVTVFYSLCVSLSIGCKTSITAEIWIPPVDAEPDAFIKIGIAECCAFIIALTYYYLYKAGSKLRNPYAGDPGDDLNLPRFGPELNMDISLILQPKYQELCEINYGKTQIHRPNWLLPWSLGAIDVPDGRRTTQDNHPRKKQHYTENSIKIAT